jgi:hypothetical protein
MQTMLITAYGFMAQLDPTPSANDTKAGWGAFALFLGMAIAVGLLGWSLTRHLKKTKLNADSGAFGEVEKVDLAKADAETGHGA